MVNKIASNKISCKKALIVKIKNKIKKTKGYSKFLKRASKDLFTQIFGNVRLLKI